MGLFSNNETLMKLDSKITAASHLLNHISTYKEPFPDYQALTMFGTCLVLRQGSRGDVVPCFRTRQRPYCEVEGTNRKQSIKLEKVGFATRLFSVKLLPELNVERFTLTFRCHHYTEIKGLHISH